MCSAAPREPRKFGSTASPRSTVLFFMWAIILNCCCCGNSCKACDAATALDAGDGVTAAADVIPSEAADPACCDRDSKPAEEDTPPESA